MDCFDEKLKLPPPPQLILFLNQYGSAGHEGLLDQVNYFFLTACSVNIDSHFYQFFMIYFKYLFYKLEKPREYRSLLVKGKVNTKGKNRNWFIYHLLLKMYSVMQSDGNMNIDTFREAITSELMISCLF